MDDTLARLWAVFHCERFHHLLVVDKGQLRGVISDRDLLKASSPFVNTLAEQNRDLAILKKRAHQIMSRKPITIRKEASLEEAVQLMLRERISCLPVVSADGGIEGIVTWRDLLKAYSQHAAVFAVSLERGHGSWVGRKRFCYEVKP
jgi:acetoin utilization protein AcuB